VEPGGDLARLVAAGALAAAIGVDDASLVPLIPDAEHAGFEALRRRGHYPINHLIVVKDELLEANPELAVDVFAAFADAKSRYVERLRAGAIEAPTPTDLMHARVLELTGRDPLPYGLEANRRALDELIDHALRQKILSRRPTLESLFAERTLGLSA
jgi:4,5-dihydroxyphthalate decarboxylase